MCRECCDFKTFPCVCVYSCRRWSPHPVTVTVVLSCFVCVCEFVCSFQIAIVKIRYPVKYRGYFSIMIMHTFSKCHSKPREYYIICGFFGVHMFALLCVCMYLHCVRMKLLCVFRCVLFVLCLLVCVAEARHDLCSLGNKPFETRDLVPYSHVPCGPWS